MRRFRWGAVAWTAALLWLQTAGAAPADEFYYVALFGSQREPNDPNYSHTFATFVRASGDGPHATEYDVEDCFTISWLPANTRVRTRALLPEPGHDFTLEETLNIVLGDGERVSMWGPYQIDERLYNGALRRYSQLNGGQVRYKAVDSGYPINRVSNCIHAVSAASGASRPRILSPSFGQTASWIVLQKFRRDIIDRDETHEWVYSYLGLENYPIIRRDFERNPRTGTFWSLLKRLVGIEP